MKTSFIRIYLLVTAVLLGTTAIAKIPAIFRERNWCSDPNILGRFQPAQLSNEELLGFAASIELLVVLLICFSPWRWLPCLAATVWGLLCFAARLFMMDPYANCHCLGWLAKPGLQTNILTAIVALLLAGGGWLAFHDAWRSKKLAKKNKPAPA
jgi:hypothetical protein